MIKTCKTCKHWQKDSENTHGSITRPVDPDTWKPMVMPFEVRMCSSPAILFHERPVESNGACVADGSAYMAVLFTAEDFGCVRHEQTAPQGGKEKE